MYLEMNAFGGRGGPHRALAFMMFRLDALYKFMQGQKGLDALAETARALRRHVKRMRKKWVQLGRTFPKSGAGLTEEDMLQSDFERFENGASVFSCSGASESASERDLDEDGLGELTDTRSESGYPDLATPIGAPSASGCHEIDSTSESDDCDASLEEEEEDEEDDEEDNDDHEAHEYLIFVFVFSTNFLNLTLPYS